MAESPFSAVNPRLQTAWDATSFGALMYCPRYYQLTIQKGWRGSMIDLDFGILVHSAFETFWKARLDGLSRYDAMLKATRWALDNSGRRTDDGKWVPWGGTYVEQWHCLGTEPYKNDKGNKAKCPYSHKGKWFMAPAPTTCGECGSATETVENWLPTEPRKNRHTLIRLVVWYCEEQPETLEEGLVPYQFPDGTKALELPFRLPLPWKAPTGENYIVCGYLDKLAMWNKEGFTVDTKTTYKTPGKAFFESFSPNIQFDIYDLTGSILYPELNLKGLIVDAAQTMVGGARFAMRPLYRSEVQREELMTDLRWWLDIAEQLAAQPEGYDYPMNRRQCWGCDFKGICSKDPDKREMYLKADFKKAHWNPLEER